MLFRSKAAEEPLDLHKLHRCLDLSKLRLIIGLAFAFKSDEDQFIKCWEKARVLTLMSFRAPVATGRQVDAIYTLPIPNKIWRKMSRSLLGGIWIQISPPVVGVK